uniref:Integrase catalytic domain-containing protein n=1 Tax=Micrurus lemniscatus lemniscatus TaxID=129467 RepID=A0A2D4H6R2_MICLE
MASFWRLFLKMLGCSQGLSSAYHPSTNGAAERTNAMVERYLRSYVMYQQTKWTDFIPFAELAYNNAVHSSTGYSPFFIVHGMEIGPIPNFVSTQKDPITMQEWSEKIQQGWDSVRTALKESTSKMKMQADKKRKEGNTFKIGDTVYLSTNTLD